MGNAGVPDGPADGGAKRDDTSVLRVGTHSINTKPTEKINTIGIHDLDRDSHPGVPPRLRRRKSPPKCVRNG